MSAVRAPQPGAMDSCNQLGIPQLKGAFGGFAGFTIFCAFVLNILAVVAAFLPWSQFVFPNLVNINFGLKYFFLIYNGLGSSVVTAGGGLLYMDPLCPVYIGSLAFPGSDVSSASASALLTVGTTLCNVCDASNTWSFMWLASAASWWFFIFLCSYIACCKCICCCNFGTFSRTVLFIMGLIVLGLCAGAKGQNSDCDAAIQAWGNLIIGSPAYQLAFGSGLKLVPTAGGSQLGVVCIALSVIMLLLTVVFPWPTGSFGNAENAATSATNAGLDAKPAFPAGAAPAYPGAAPAYPGAAPAYPGAAPAYPKM